ncbi:MAG: UDP-N-acetylmuramoyl-tripeptide--D-alanyl-D-alanine ligase [Flavobacteriaceae bacterium]|nr:UDP-N-acetylmuramoyl-tripeptide--D-alanyl-D-alanine ligase [Flavobacteriaceae bacterium]MDZ4148158.1 UDP-N-acetylmuramoyl-tripeptide--D-alanyl-D-alanine ligase [Flavobacteriaceae bacterium]
MNIQTLYPLFKKSKGISIDSRKIDANQLFFALKGVCFDGNLYAKAALEKGASLAVIDNPEFYIDERTILVENSEKTLQDLANHHRKQFDIPIVALTGSNGKTTTKELIAAVLSTTFKTVATKGNLNNHLGVPLTLLNMADSTEIAIIEMGANHQGEIAQLCKIAEPNYGLITNFGKAHLEGFGGVEGVIKGKSELYDFIIQQQGMLFVNADDSIQIEKTKYANRFLFSKNDESADLKISLLEKKPSLVISFDETIIRSQLIGEYNFYNIAIAVSIGKHFGVANQQIVAAIETYLPQNNRSQIIKKNSNQIILDAYNANPSSMKAALDNFADSASKQKIIVLGDMFELGSTSLEEHQKIADRVAEINPKIAILVGNDFYQTFPERPNIKKFKSLSEASEYLKHNPVSESEILIKGSRGMAMEKILDVL